jgi:hypothetical protein
VHCSKKQVNCAGWSLSAHLRDAACFGSPHDVPEPANSCPACSSASKVRVEWQNPQGLIEGVI